MADTVAEKAIRDALAKWTDDFNARDATRICDLFAPDLRYDFRGSPERDYDAMCSALHRALGDRSKTMVYSFDIKEIIVSGDMAIVRLVWTSGLSRDGSSPGDRDQGAWPRRVPPPGGREVADLSLHGVRSAMMMASLAPSMQSCALV